MMTSGRIVLFCLFGALTTLLRAEDALALQSRLIEVFEANRDAVVRIKAAYTSTSEEEGKARVLLRVGSGFFISNEGHVLVSASRAVGADRVWVEFKGKTYTTEAVGHDRLTNISVLKLVDPPEEFSIIPIDPSVELPVLGSLVVAIACPLDFEPSPSMGIVTGMDKRLGNKLFPTPYIRTSVSVDGGQGGGPLLDINGRFIGMTVAAIPEINSSYCLPADALARVRDDLMFSGKIIHSWMGFEVAEPLDGRREEGVVLSNVIEGGPAADAGLMKGDELISIAGRPVSNVSDVPGAVFFTRANQFASIVVQRDGEELELSVKTVPRPEPKAAIKPTEVSQATPGEGAAEESEAVEQ